MRKPHLHKQNSGSAECAVTTQLISAFVFATEIVQPLFLNPALSVKQSSVVVQPGLCRTYLLTFDKQVSNNYKKASQQINVLKRISKYLNFESRKAVYHAFIMSTF